MVACRRIWRPLAVLATALFTAILIADSSASTRPPLLFQSGPVTNLNAYWPLDETALGTANDLSGNLNNGTHVNSPTISTALPPMPNYACNQRSLSFNPANTQRVNVPDSPSLSVTGSLTLAAWVRTTGALATQQGIIEKFDGPSPYFNGYYIRLTTTLGVNFNIVPAAGTPQGFTTGGTTVAPNTWTHVAGTYNQTSGLMRIYMNGNPHATTLTATAPPGDGTSPLSIGASGTSQKFSGEIDEPRVFSRALSQAELQILMNGQPPPTGLSATPGPNQVALTWMAAAGATGYSVYRSTSATGPFSLVGSPATPSYTDTGAMFPGTYYYYVKAVSVMESCPTATLSASPLSGVPPPPRFNNHSEGLLGDRCECGTASGTPRWTAALAAFVLLCVTLASRRRPQGVTEYPEAGRGRP